MLNSLELGKMKLKSVTDNFITYDIMGKVDTHMAVCSVVIRCARTKFVILHPRFIRCIEGTQKNLCVDISSRQFFPQIVMKLGDPGFALMGGVGCWSLQSSTHWCYFCPFAIINMNIISRTENSYQKQWESYRIDAFWKYVIEMAIITHTGEVL